MTALWFALILSVHDGDTFRARVTTWIGETQEINVRLLGVDTPELNGKCPAESKAAIDARKALQSLLIGNVAYLSQLQADKYGGRVIATVTTPAGVDVAGELLRRGLAVSYSGKGPKHNWCAPQEGKQKERK